MNYNPADYFVQSLAIIPGEEEQCRDRVKVRSVLYVLTFRTTVNCSYTAISRKVVGKLCTRQSQKVIWDMINTLFLTL